MSRTDICNDSDGLWIQDALEEASAINTCSNPVSQGHQLDQQQLIDNAGLQVDVARCCGQPLFRAF